METAIILQARLGSKRFPGKVLKKINGKTIIEHKDISVIFIRKTMYFLFYDDRINKVCY